MFGVKLVRLVRIQVSVLTVTLKGAGLQSGWSFSPAAPWRQVRAGERHSVPTERERWKEAESSSFSQSEDKRQSQVSSSSCCCSLFLLFVGRGVNGPENKARRGRGGGRMERTEERRPVGNCHLTDERTRLTDRWESRPQWCHNSGGRHEDSKCRNKNNHSIKLNWKGEKQNKMNLKWQKNIARESKLKWFPKIKKSQINRKNQEFKSLKPKT